MASKKSDLPKEFFVKYLGKRNASGLWGVRHTKAPVEDMVNAAKNLKPGATLPYVELTVCDKGVKVTPRDRTHLEDTFHAIDTISYGVQDLYYTRVFSMIVVRELGDLKGQHPFECHAFACDSRRTARQLTKALAMAFKGYSETIKAEEKKCKTFAIDLRTPEEIEAELRAPHATDSEA